ncbi:hypothetical protein HZB60_04115 [candidate division KSB1 bacterium]|nr:hypothetical protein [candidate division KSB1 bacterium]
MRFKDILVYPKVDALNQISDANGALKTVATLLKSADGPVLPSLDGVGDVLLIIHSAIDAARDRQFAALLESAAEAGTGAPGFILPVFDAVPVKNRG